MANSNPSSSQNIADADFADASRDFAEVALDEEDDDENLLMPGDTDALAMPGEHDFEPMSRGRANTWHGLHVDKSMQPEEQSVDTKPSLGQLGGTSAVSRESLLGGKKGASGRRNAWGSLSYADLITQAIESSAEKRLALAQIYDWMTKNVPYFCDKGETSSSAGWKNSIRHNLSLHSRFRRLQNEGSSKSSYWTMNYDAMPPAKGPRRRASTLDSKLYDKKRPNARRNRAAAEPDSASGGLRPPLSSGSNSGSMNRLSAIEPINEKDELMGANTGAVPLGEWELLGTAPDKLVEKSGLPAYASWDGFTFVDVASGKATNAGPLEMETEAAFDSRPDVGAGSGFSVGGELKQFLPIRSKPAETAVGVDNSVVQLVWDKSTNSCHLVNCAPKSASRGSSCTDKAGSNCGSKELATMQPVASPDVGASIQSAAQQQQQSDAQLNELLRLLVVQPSQQQQQQIDEKESAANQRQQQLQQLLRSMGSSEYLKLITYPEFWTSGRPKLIARVREILLAKKAEMLEAERLAQESATEAPLVSQQHQLLLRLLSEEQQQLVEVIEAGDAQKNVDAEPRDDENIRDLAQLDLDDVEKFIREDGFDPAVFNFDPSAQALMCDDDIFNN